MGAPSWMRSLPFLLAVGILMAASGHAQSLVPGDIVVSQTKDKAVVIYNDDGAEKFRITAGVGQPYEVIPSLDGCAAHGPHYLLR